MVLVRSRMTSQRLTHPLTQVDTFIATRTGQRNIVVTIGFNPNYTINEDVTTLRYALLKVFTPGYKIEMTFENFEAGFIKTYKMNGVVETNEPVIFSPDPQVQISIICPYPYFTAVENAVVWNCLTGQTRSRMSTHICSRSASNLSLTSTQHMIGLILFSRAPVIPAWESVSLLLLGIRFDSTRTKAFESLSIFEVLLRECDGLHNGKSCGYAASSRQKLDSIQRNRLDEQRQNYLSTNLPGIVNMDLYRCDYTLQPVEIVDDYESLIWTDRYVGAGDFKLVVKEISACLGYGTDISSVF